MLNSVIVVDDEASIRSAVEQWLNLSGFNVQLFARAEDCLAQLPCHFPGVVISDVRMPGMGGLQLLERLQADDPDLPVILLTGHGDVPMAVEAMRIGAMDFMEKPFNPERLTELVKRAGQARRMTLDNRALRRDLSEGQQVMSKLIGASPVMDRLREDIIDLGQADGHVLIDGETGTGKTLVAHALHAVGPRASKKFVPISCAAYNDEVLAGKLFGPVENGLPAVEEARGGTLCLEDIEALSDPLQARLLAFIAEQGAPAETRIIAISNARGEGRKAEDSLRPDLFYRLTALKITLPPLRSRGEDILSLFTRMTEQFSEEYGCEPPQVTAQEAAQLLQAPWPGNVRQLINVAERAVLQNRRGSGSIASLLMADGEDNQEATTTEGKPLKEYVESFEKMLIDNTMRRHKGSIAAVMDELCLPRRTLNEKMAKYGLSRGDYL
jgi:DNA-binding NtrC family response regulator